MTAAGWAQVLTAAAALIAAGGWIFRLSFRPIEKDKLIAEASKAKAEGAATLMGAAGALIDDLRIEQERHLARIQALEMRCAASEEREQKCCAELRRLQAVTA